MKNSHRIIFFFLDFLASSISAVILILIGIIPQIYALDHSPNSLFNKDFCKTRTYIGQSSAMLCRWLLTIACVDRCLLISTNGRLRHFSTVRIARKVVLLLCIIWLIVPIYIIIFTDVRKSGYILCMMSTSGAAFYHVIYTIIAGGLIPPFIMLICTKIIWTSLQLKRQRRQTIILNIGENKRDTRDIQVVIMLLLQVIIFIVFNLPYMSYNLYLASTRSVINKTEDRIAIETFMQSFTEVTVFIYPAISFYSNTLASQTFRNEFFHLFSWIFTCGYKERVRNRRRIGPNTITVIHAKRNVLPMVVIN